MNEPTDLYNDIISLPHHVSAYRPQMPMHNRAAQFAPFAALSGYEEGIESVNADHRNR